MYRFIVVFVALLTLGSGTTAAAFDHQHSAWNQLLAKHVRWINNGSASQVNYAGLQQDRAAMQAYLDSLSAISQSEFDSWNRDQRLAFLINAYNAFTVQLILSKYPQLKSIKDLGSLLRSPWKKKFFTLLGKKRHLDNIEHDLIRARGAYDEPLIHVAVVCASIGCPALRTDAFTANNLDFQLQDSMKRFLSDHSRNRHNPQSDALEVSEVFKWYRKDFEQGHRGYRRLNDLFAAYAQQLTDDPQVQQRIQRGEVKIRHLKYDWALNAG